MLLIHDKEYNMKLSSLGFLLTGTVLLTACGGSDSNTENTPKPNTPVPVQPVKLPDNFSYVKEPLLEIKAQPLYNLNYWAQSNPVELASYSILSQATDGKFTTAHYATGGGLFDSGNWRLDTPTSLVFNIQQNKWLESDNALTVSEGLVGSAGIKTIHVVSDTGVKYYTLAEKDLSNLTLDKGVNIGFGEGRKLPQSISTKTYSQGAKAYAWIQDITQPVYEINRTHYVFTTNNYTHPIYSCQNIGNCSTTSVTLEDAITNKAWYQNGGENASIRIVSNGQALLSVYDATQQKDLTYPLTYTLNQAKQGAPKNIVFTAPNADVQKLLASNFTIGDGQVAWYEYENKVVIGSYLMPTMGLQSTQYSYNKVAINDILTKWNPSNNPVLN